MDEFGEFWQERDTLDFYSTRSNNELNIYLNTNEPDERLSFIIDDAEQLTTINFYKQNGEQIYYAASEWTDGASIFCSPEPQQFQQPTGLAELNNNTAAIVYPNPASSIVYINIENATSGNYTLNVYDALGQSIIHSQQMRLSAAGRLTFQWNVEQLTQGYYFFSIQSESVSTNGKLIVVH